MKISVRLEGGLGDHILGARFIPPILDKYPGAKIYAYSDSEGNSFQKEALEQIYPSLFEEIFIIPHKKYKTFTIESQFGRENYIAALDNVPDKWRDEMNSYDKFYDLQVDMLDWLNHDFDWFRYFKFFPPAEIKKDENVKPYIALQLHTSRSGVKNKNHYLESWYTNSLVNAISKEYECRIISTPELLGEYEDLRENDNVKIFVGEMREVINEIKNASLFIGIDSGLRFVGYAFGIPALLFGVWYKQPFWCAPMHAIRWSFYPEQCFPLHHDYKHISSLASSIMKNKAMAMYPFTKDFDDEFAVRHWKHVGEDELA